MAKKKYLVIANVSLAIGTQTYEIAASSPEDALAIYHSHDCPECVSEELEVQHIGDVEVTEIVEVAAVKDTDHVEPEEAKGKKRRRKRN